MKQNWKLGTMAAVAVAMLLLAWGLVGERAGAAGSGGPSAVGVGLPPAAPQSCSNLGFTRTDYPVGALPKGGGGGRLQRRRPSRHRRRQREL